MTLFQRSESAEVLRPHTSARLHSVIKILESTYKVELLDLTPRAGVELGKVKEFLTGLLENPKKHPFFGRIGHFGRKQFVSIAGTLFLSRKIIDDKPLSQAEKEKICEEYFESMSKESPPPDPSYMAHVTEVTESLFPRGWDRDYSKYVFNHVPSSSRCKTPCGKSGYMRDFISHNGRQVFIDNCLGNSYPDIQEPTVNYSLVDVGGKYRGVCTQLPQNEHLAPLHKLIYDKISREDWLLRGEAKARRFKNFHKKEGEVFVSGDYQSATDNLNIHVTRQIIEIIMRNSTRVSSYVKDLAIATLQSRLEGSGTLSGIEPVYQRRGQLMGNYLSFPLLCIQNYAAFSFLVPDKCPVKINGDDIVFRASQEIANKWLTGVNKLGFKLSLGKTLVKRNFFSLNSSFFTAWTKSVRDVPVIRMKKVTDSPPSAGDYCRFTRGWKGLDKERIGGLWLKDRKKQIFTLGRSVVSGLGIPASNSALHFAGMIRYEAFFRGRNAQVQIKENKVSPFRSKNGPEEELLNKWFYGPCEKKDRLERNRCNKIFFKECFTSAWKPRETVENKKDLWWKREISTGNSVAYFSWKRLTSRYKTISRELINPTLRLIKRPIKERCCWQLKTDLLKEEKMPSSGNIYYPFQPELYDCDEFRLQEYVQ